MHPTNQGLQTCFYFSFLVVGDSNMLEKGQLPSEILASMNTSGQPVRFNLTDYFIDRHIREGSAGEPALRCAEHVHTYGDLAADVCRAGNGLLQLGLQEEQRVLLVLPDCPEFVIAYFAVMKIGGVAVPTTNFARTADYEYFLRESKARILIVHSTVFSEIAAALSEQRYLRHVIVVGERQTGHILWDEWLAGNSPELRPAETSGDDVAFWLWTSGSTGRPKAAVHLHYDWIYCCRNYAVEVLGITTTDITFSSSKLFHAYGLGNGLMFPFYVGASAILLTSKAQARAVLDVLREPGHRFFSPFRHCMHRCFKRQTKNRTAWIASDLQFQLPSHCLPKFTAGFTVGLEWKFSTESGPPRHCTFTYRHGQAT